VILANLTDATGTSITSEWSLELTSLNISQTGGEVTLGTTTAAKNYFSYYLDSVAIAWSPNLLPFSVALQGALSAPSVSDLYLEAWSIQSNGWYVLPNGDNGLAHSITTCHGSGRSVFAKEFEKGGESVQLPPFQERD
jgi:hypothetical protein